LRELDLCTLKGVRKAWEGSQHFKRKKTPEERETDTHPQAEAGDHASL